MFMFIDGSISWRSVKETIIVISTIEVEFVSYSEATSYGVQLKSFIFGLTIVDFISRPLRMFCDNSTIVFMANNNKGDSGNEISRLSI